MERKKELAEYAANLRIEWEREKGMRPKLDQRRHKFVRPDPNWGYIRRTVDDNIPALKITQGLIKKRRKKTSII